MQHELRMGDEAICTREQCRFLGSAPEPPTTGTRAVVASGLSLIAHFGCFPLLLFSPITFPLMVIVIMARMKNPCPACKREQLVPTDTPRGEVLKARLPK